MTDIRFTGKQLEILSVIKNGNPDGSLVTVYDLIDRVSYECKRDAMLHSLRVLVENGYVERKGPVKIKGKAMQVFMLTTKSLRII